jgi:hypothetical protein
MNNYFVKNEEFAKKVDSDCTPYTKELYGNTWDLTEPPFASMRGFKVETHKTKKQLEHEGILVSSL